MRGVFGTWGQTGSGTVLLIGGSALAELWGCGAAFGRLVPFVRIETAGWRAAKTG